MPSYTLVPAYGRDYKSKAAVLADFDADKDFIDSGFHSSGKPVNKADIKSLGGGEISIRYSSLRKVTVVRVEAD